MQATILLYGNCQAEHLAQIGRYLPSLRDTIAFKAIPSHIVTADDWAQRFDARFTADVQVLWEQVEGGDATANRRALQARMQPDWQVVRFPPYSMLALWPFAGHDPRLGESPRYRYPWPDSVAATVAQEGLQDDDAAFARYMLLCAERMPDLERRLRLDVARWQAADELADIKEADWVLETFRQRQIFSTAGHVTAVPLGRMMKQLLERTAILTARQVWQAKLEVDLLLRRHRGQDVEVVPVHPVVAERMGLRYYDPEARHRWHAHEWTFREYTVNYIRWAPFLEQ